MSINFRNFLISFLAFIILGGCTTVTTSINDKDAQGTTTLTNETEQYKLDGELQVLYINVGQADSTLFQFTESGKKPPNSPICSVQQSGYLF